MTIEAIVTSDTLLRRYRHLVARKYDGGSRRGGGRPRTAVEIHQLVIKMTGANPGRGYTRIRGALYHSAYAERFVQSIKSECLSKVIPLSESHLRRMVTEYTGHYHLERNHQGLGNRLIDRSRAGNRKVGRVECRERLGGLLSFYEREAA